MAKRQEKRQETQTAAAPLKPVGLLTSLGPGLVTGAADDDPSGIATYSQVGAQFGYGLAWTMLFSFPLMAVIQSIAARIGAGFAGPQFRLAERHVGPPFVSAVFSAQKSCSDGGTQNAVLQLGGGATT